MSYEYAKERPHLFTESGSVMFLKIRDHVHNVLKISGAIQLDKAMNAPNLGSFLTWEAIACVDRLVELKEIREVEQRHDVAGQNRIFVSNR